MNWSQFNPAYRAIMLVGLIQVGVIVGGTLYVTAMLKLHGFGNGDVPDDFFNPHALFVRRDGFLLLLVPLAWTLSAIWTMRVNSPTWLNIMLLGLGILAIPVGIWRYVWLGINATIF